MVQKLFDLTGPISGLNENQDEELEKYKLTQCYILSKIYNIHYYID